MRENNHQEVSGCNERKDVDNKPDNEELAVNGEYFDKRTEYAASLEMEEETKPD